MEDRIKTLKQTVSSRLQVEAQQISDELQVQHLVLHEDAIIPAKHARKQFFWKALGDVWYAIERLIVIGFVAGLGLAIYVLLGVLLK